MPAPIGSLQVPQHRVVVPRLWVAPQNKFRFFFKTEIEIIKKEANTEFTDGLVVGILCITTVAGFNPGQGTDIPQAVQWGKGKKKKEPNRQINWTEILLLKITVNEMQQNEKCYREHQQQQKSL